MLNLAPMVREQNTASWTSAKVAPGYTYSPDSRYLAVTERHLGKEYIGVYDILDGYNLLRVS